MLESFSAQRPILSTAEIATLTGLKRPTAARLAFTLVELGYLARTEKGYRLGLRALTIVHPVLASMDVRQIARPLMQDLAQRRARHRFDRRAGRMQPRLCRNRAVRRHRPAYSRHRLLGPGSEYGIGPRPRLHAAGGGARGAGEAARAGDARSLARAAQYAGVQHQGLREAWLHLFLRRPGATDLCRRGAALSRSGAAATLRSIAASRPFGCATTSSKRNSARGSQSSPG